MDPIRRRVAVLVGLAALFAGGGCADRDQPPPSDGGPEIRTPTAAPPPGDLADWAVRPGQRLDADSDTFVADVTRAGCNGGVTGEVTGPVVTVQEDEVVVTFGALPEQEGLATCPSNEVVTVEVELPEPLGRRVLVDGVCTVADLRGSCEDPVRWRP